MGVRAPRPAGRHWHRCGSSLGNHESEGSWGIKLGAGFLAPRGLNTPMGVQHTHRAMPGAPGWCPRCGPPPPGRFSWSPTDFGVLITADGAVIEGSLMVRRLLVA